MKGFRQEPRQLSSTIHICNEFVNDYLAVSKTLLSKEEYTKKKQQIKSAIKAYSKNLTAKRLSGFKSMIIEMTKLETLKGN
jgi:ribosomal protein S4